MDKRIPAASVEATTISIGTGIRLFGPHQSGSRNKQNFEFQNEVKM
jgi:hypothetical protein